MTWKPEIDELRKRIALACQMGGEKRIARQHEFGKMTIRERLDAFIDKETFHEIGSVAGKGEYDEDGNLVSFTPSNLIFGTAQVDGRPVIVTGDDFTVRGGSAEASIAGKRIKAEGLACEMRLPHIRLVDGMAGGGSVKSIEIVGRTYIPILRGWDIVIEHMAVAPSVSLALGSVAGLGAARVATSHYSVIVSETAQMMIAGPALVAQAAMGNVSKEELGHARIHAGNGSVDDMVATEKEAFERARRFLSFLPTNVDELPPITESNDPPDRKDEHLVSVIPRNPRQTYDMRSILTSVADKDSLFEIGRNWGRSAICCLARFDGIPVAIFAEDPNIYGGSWTAHSCRKMTRLIDLASTFHLPLIHIQDCPGFLIGKSAEESGTIRFGSQTLAAIGQSPVPYCCIVVRKSFGVAGASNYKSGSHHFRYAWPSGDWGSLPIEGGIEVAYKAELEEADDYDAHLARIKERLNKARSPFRTAEYFEIEDIIDPRDTRPILCRWAHLARKSLKPGRQAFHMRP